MVLRGLGPRIHSSARASGDIDRRAAPGDDSSRFFFVSLRSSSGSLAPRGGAHRYPAAHAARGRCPDRSRILASGPQSGQAGSRFTLILRNVVESAS